ncbi:hypothetical protein [Umezawaea tangerina]|uniref:hypothetical protein n=1 Tax=Umezawaea tangerina TaxID=84725 RepID=UPI0011B28038|nr:hypothetical protein [Umezawaea tangerina]
MKLGESPVSEASGSRVRALSRILYDRDPFSMGSSISAPDDEYDSFAVKLVPLLGRVVNIEECGRVLESQGIHDDGVVREVWAMFKKDD